MQEKAEGSDPQLDRDHWLLWSRYPVYPFRPRFLLIICFERPLPVALRELVYSLNQLHQCLTAPLYEARPHGSNAHTRKHKGGLSSAASHPLLVSGMVPALLGRLCPLELTTNPLDLTYLRMSQRLKSLGAMGVKHLPPLLYGLAIRHLVCV